MLAVDILIFVFEVRGYPNISQQKAKLILLHKLKKVEIRILINILNFNLVELNLLILIHTLQLNFMFSDWLFGNYAECIENVQCNPRTVPRMFEVLLLRDPACDHHIN